MNGFTQRLVVILFSTFALACPRVKAQNESDASREPSKGFLAVKTNLVEWTAAIPNFSVMTDLSGKPWNRSVAGITLKYKWPTKETYVPSFTYSLFEVRPEYRYYMKQLFVGGYAAYDSFTTRLPKKAEGWQGIAWGGGISVGWELALYQYRRSALDLELGASIGAHYTDYLDFTVAEDGMSAVLATEHTRKVLPYPELRVALVWRKTSVKDKYNSTDPMKAIFKSEAEAIQINYDVTNRENFDAMHQSKLKVYQKSVFMDLYEGDQSAYRADFEAYLQESFVDIALDNIEHSRLDERFRKKLRSRVESLQRKALADFDKSVRAELRAGKVTGADENQKED